MLHSLKPHELDPLTGVPCLHGLHIALSSDCEDAVQEAERAECNEEPQAVGLFRIPHTLCATSALFLSFSPFFQFTSFDLFSLHVYLILSTYILCFLGRGRYFSSLVLSSLLLIWSAQLWQKEY